jgi:hypothetical protein
MLLWERFRNLSGTQGLRQAIFKAHLAQVTFANLAPHFPVRDLVHDYPAQNSEVHRP